MTFWCLVAQLCVTIEILLVASGDCPSLAGQEMTLAALLLSLSGDIALDMDEFVQTIGSLRNGYSDFLRNIRAPKITPTTAQASNTSSERHKSDHTYPVRTKPRTPTMA